MTNRKGIESEWELHHDCFDNIRKKHICNHVLEDNEQHRNVIFSSTHKSVCKAVFSRMRQHNVVCFSSTRKSIWKINSKMRYIRSENMRMALEHKAAAHQCCFFKHAENHMKMPQNGCYAEGSQENGKFGSRLPRADLRECRYACVIMCHYERFS